MLKRKTKLLDSDMFMIVWLVVYTIAITKVAVHVEPRFMMPAFIPMFIICGRGLVKLGEFLIKLLKDNLRKMAYVVSIVVVLALLFWGGYSELVYAKQTIEIKADSFYYEKFAGAWLAENTEEGDTILSCNQIPVLAYYSGRVVFHMGQNTTKADGIIEEKSPKYIIIDAYNSDCAFDYPNNNPDQFEIVQAYFLDEEMTQPIILIYEIKYD